MRRVISIVGLAGVLAVIACAAPYGEGPEVNRDTDAGVTGTDSTEPSPDPVPPAAPVPRPRETPTLPAKDGGSSGGNAGDGSATDPAACPSKANPTLRNWKTPPPASSVCTAADMTYFAQVAANETWVGVETLMRARNTDCATCIFSNEADAAWRPIVYVGEAGDARVNYAACFARAPGGSDLCGRGVDQWSDCYAKVCSYDACGTIAAQEACYAGDTVFATCDSYNPIATACGGSARYASLANLCGTYVDVVRVSCADGN
jgi:hypothetical protein